MVDVMAEMRTRVAEGEEVESIRRDMIVKNYPTNEVERAAKALDWISEKRELEDSGKMDKYENALEAESNKLFRKRVLIIIFGIIAIVLWIMIFGDVLGIMGAVFILVIMSLLYSGVQSRGIH